MAHYERGKDEDRVFDGGEDQDETEGSHLPVVIIIAILVLAAFGGVVWLAYNQGLARGRNDTPMKIASVEGNKSSNGLKIFQQRAGGDEDGASPVKAAAQPSATDAVPAQSVVRHDNEIPPEQAPPAAHAQAVEPSPIPPATKPPAQLGQPQPAQPQPVKPEPVKPQAVKPVEKPKPEPAKPVPAKPEPAKPVPAKPEPAKAASGGYYLQIGAYKSETEALTAWKGYAAKHAGLLNGFGPDVQRADLGDKGVWYRLRIASFPNKDGANALCDRLKAQGGACFLAR